MGWGRGRGGNEHSRETEVECMPARLHAVGGEGGVVDHRRVAAELLEHLAALEPVHAHAAVKRAAQHLVGGDGGWGGSDRMVVRAGRPFGGREGGRELRCGQALG